VALRSVVLRVFCGGVLAGLAVLALRRISWGLAVHEAVQVGPGALALALAATVLSMLISGAMWTRVLWCLGYRTSVRVGIIVLAGTGLAAYVGTSAGALGESVLLLRKHGVCAGRAVMLLALASLVGFCGAMAWVPCGVIVLATPAALHVLPLLGTAGPLIAIVATLVCAMGALAGLVLTTLVPRFASCWGVRHLAGGTAEQPLRLSLGHLLPLILVAALAWLVGSGPLWVLVRVVAPQASVSLVTAVGVQTIAAVAGGCAFFLPNGLGARDGVIVALLASVAGVPLPAAAAVALLVRLSDPTSKVLILLVVTGLNRIPVPTLAPRWPARASFSRMQNLLQHAGNAAGYWHRRAA